MTTDDPKKPAQSDLRLKENVRRIGRTRHGLPFYTFSYIGKPGLYAGVMAHDVLPAYLAGILKAIPQPDPPACRISHAESAMVVRSSHRIVDIKRIFTSIGPLHKLAVEGLPPTLKVDRFIRRLGLARSQPPRLNWQSIDLDLADGRVRLGRASPLRDRLRKMAMTDRPTACVAGPPNLRPPFGVWQCPLAGIELTLPAVLRDGCL
jgi:hypothetical protein